MTVPTLRRRPFVTIAVALLLVLGYAGVRAAVGFTLARVSGTSGNQPAPPDEVRGEVTAQGLSQDGRYLLVRSWSPEHGADPDLGRDVWVIRDLETGTTLSTPIQNAAGAGPLTGGRSQAVLSGDGTRYAVADKLSEGNIKIRRRGYDDDVWGSNTVSNVTKLSLSTDGQKLAFDGDYDDWGQRNVFIVDTTDGSPDLVSEDAEEPGEQGNRDSFYPALSGNGQWLAFVSNATDLIADDANDDSADLFLKDLEGDTLTKVAPVGPQDHFDPPSDLLSALPDLSDDGKVLAFASTTALVDGDTNAAFDVYTYDTSGSTPVIACVSCTLTQGNGKEAGFPVVSADGAIVTFSVGPENSNPEDAWRFDRTSSDLTSLGATYAPLPALPTEDGCKIAFTSYADGRVAGDANEVGDAFVATVDNCGVQTSDTDPPVITCTPSAADGQWHADNVTFACTASDTGSGLASSADASFNLETNVEANEEWANASTGSRSVCDNASPSNCAPAGPIGDNRIDRRPPMVVINTPSINATYTVGTTVPANYSCTDNGSGMASCAGPAASGQALDTSTPGLKSFLVTGTDNVGNMASLDVPYTVVAAPGAPTIAALIAQVTALPNFPGKQVLIRTLQVADRYFQRGNVTGTRVSLRLAAAGIQAARALGLISDPAASSLLNQIAAILRSL